MSSQRIEFVVNGRAVAVEADDGEPLLTVLRNRLGLRGTRYGCGMEQCGACMVVIDGAAVASCTRPVGSVAGCSIETVEGLARDGTLHPLQEAVVAEQAGQCGYCLSGILMSAHVLLAHDPRPDRAQILAALDRHLCRCGVANRILRAVERAAARMQA